MYRYVYYIIICIYIYIYIIIFLSISWHRFVPHDLLVVQKQQLSAPGTHRATNRTRHRQWWSINAVKRTRLVVKCHEQVLDSTCFYDVLWVF